MSTPMINSVVAGLGGAAATAATGGSLGQILTNSLMAGVAVGTISSLLGATVTGSSAYTTNTVAQFPSDLINTTSGRTFYITFWFYQYQRPSVYVTPYMNPIGQIVLPLPANLIDAQSENWTQVDNSNSPMVGAGLDAAAQAIASGQSTTQGLINGAAGAFSGTAAQTAQNLGSTIGNAIGQPNAGAQALQLAGLAINPFLTVLFTSPVFKRYQFSWVFTPVNQIESDTLKFILNKFRYHQLPDVNLGVTAGSLLQYPDIVVPVITPSGYVFTYKRCIIENSTVNYSPGATPGFFNNSLSAINGNAPVSVTLTLSLLEIEYGTKSTVFNPPFPDSNYSVPGDVNAPQQFAYNLGVNNPALMSSPTSAFPQIQGGI